MTSPKKNTVETPPLPILKDLEQTLQFIVELDKLKNVIRKSWITDTSRYENSAEHSWHVAMLAMSLAPFADEPIHIQHVIQLLLIHDIGEIMVGDTSIYATPNSAHDKTAERNGAKQIFKQLPAPQEQAFLALWDEFEENATAEARFANAMDRLIPALLNLSCHGKGWQEQQIHKSDVLARVLPKVQLGCTTAAHWLEQALNQAEKAGYFAPTTQTNH